MITVISCGISNGGPPPGDLWFDCTSLPDPSPIIHDTPGTAPGVFDLIERSNPMVMPVVGLLVSSVRKLSAFQEDVSVVLVCSAGWHRSVALAEAVAQRLRASHEVQVIHRDLVVKQ